MDTTLSTSKAPVSTSNPTSVIDKLRQCKGYEHLSQEQALHILQTLEAFCQIAVQAFTPPDNQ